MEVRRLGDEHRAAAIPLTAGQPSPVLVWDEHCGWCTAISRRHPIDEDTGSAPEGEGIRSAAASGRSRPDCSRRLPTATKAPCATRPRVAEGVTRRRPEPKRRSSASLACATHSRCCAAGVESELFGNRGRVRT
ncbi:hypothetical protein OG930_01985 [Streptomyces sp. NBC_01799]|nr:hypothetical protein OIE65_02125 [Streptomyces sp. NBC_01800]WSA82098.1 hypothetical protein OG930_01985 [Streptomyces sp. NBC_01799]